MARGTAKDFLVRVVLDEAFRKLAVADPQRAFEGYDLSEAEQAILTSRDDRMLELLGRAVRHGQGRAGTSSANKVISPAGSPPQALPEVKMLLHLAPQTRQAAGSESAIAYAASLHPWRQDEATGAPPNSDALTAKVSECGVEGVSWMIHIIPFIVGTHQSGLEVAYSASIHPLPNNSFDAARPTDAKAKEPAGSPWNHRVDSAAAKSAAQAVKTAAPEQRYARLLDLIQALQLEDNGG